jgi:hypothetical protein
MFWTTLVTLSISYSFIVSLRNDSHEIYNLSENVLARNHYLIWIQKITQLMIQAELLVQISRKCGINPVISNKALKSQGLREISA